MQELVIVVGTILIVILAALAIRSKALDIPGSLVGALISFAALLAGGIGWLVIIVAFVLISSALTRYRYDYKRNLGFAQEKGGVRSWPNALANGLVGSIVAIGKIDTHQEIYAVAYAGAIACAMSDTIATEIGLLSKSRPRLIYDIRRFVTPGTSGGISGLGEFAGLISALGISGLAIGLGVFSGARGNAIYAFIAVVVAAIIAMNFDSLLGATVQGKNKCRVCGIQTESLHHHGQPTISEGGARFLDNNVVNLLATLVAAVISVLIYLAFVS